jgi:hypothetical protein
MLLANWLIIVATVAVNDVTLLDRLGLLNVLPMHFTAALISAPVLVFIAIYLGRYRVSILFVALFLMYIRLTTYMIEPLRGIDTLVHFSRVVVISDLGRLPSTQQFYFDFPGSSILASSLLCVTGLNDIFFLHYLFPTFALFVQYSGILVFLRKTFRDSRYVALGLLLSSFFPPSGALDFSPATTALMFFPLLLYFFLYSDSLFHYLCFLVLSFSITISNPTATLFSLFVFLAFIILVGIRYRHSKLESHFRYKALVFEVIFFSWVAFQSYTVRFQIAVNVREFLNTILIGQSKILTRLSPPMVSIYEISFARRLYYGTGVFLSLIILLSSAIVLFKNHKKNRQNPKSFFGPTFIFVCLALSLIFFITLSGHPFGEVALMYALFGISVAVGFLMIFNSKRRFFIFCALMVLLTAPTFISFYPFEQYFLIRKSSYNGLRFAGEHISHAEAGIVCDFGEQLFSFTNMDLWDKIYFDYPVYGGSRPLPPNPNYYIFRIETFYYEELSFGNSSYFENYGKFLNSNRFNNIYSSENFKIFQSSP